MAIASRLAAAGLPSGAARAINGNVGLNLTSVGNSQGTALDLPDAICVFTTVAASTGARLPANADVGDQYIVYNGGANALLVYPPLAGKINNLAANASLSVATTKAANFVCVAAGQWIGVLGT